MSSQLSRYSIPRMDTSGQTLGDLEMSVNIQGGKFSLKQSLYGDNSNLILTLSKLNNFTSSGIIINAERLMA
jgi:hypothetical protein